MKAFILQAPYQIEFQEYDEPILGPQEVRIRSIVSGIKHGTEMNIYRGHTPFLNQTFDSNARLFMPLDDGGLYPTNLGSWLVGEVIEVGAEVKRLQVGDKVHAPMPHRPTNIRHEELLYPLAEGMKPETALFTDPAIFALGAIHDAQIKLGDRVAIFGMGALGLLAIQIARLDGAEMVIAVDTLPERLALAQQLGADAVLNAKDCDAGLEIKRLTGQKGVDVAIDMSGSYAALYAAIRGVHVCGLIVSASYYSGPRQLDLGAEWHHNRPTFVSSMPVWGMPHRCAPMWNLERTEKTALRLLETGRLITDPIIGKTFAYHDAVLAYQLIDQYPEAGIKTLFYYGED